MNIILFDDHNRDQLLPLTFTRPVGELRIGILKIREKWEKLMSATCSYATEKYLETKYPLSFEEDNICLMGGLLPDNDVVQKIKDLKANQYLVQENRIIAFRGDKEACSKFLETPSLLPGKQIQLSQAEILDFPWQIFSQNGKQIEWDYDMLTKGRTSARLSDSNRILGKNIFVEEGVKAEFATINTESGPVYLGKNSELMEGSLIRGPFALCQDSTIKMGAKIYGPTTIGPESKAGGEINNCVILGYSNKGHDGFLGNSVIGEWCNLGADTNNSNLKNNYAEVKLWSHNAEKFISTGLQFCGLIMGDHSKCGINTMFNTGTVVGVNANIFGAGFLRNFIPSFSWGGTHGMIVFKIEKAFEVAEKVMARRNVNFDQVDKDILAEVFKLTEKYRK